MKLKYMYQQMLSHIGIIIVAFLVLSLVVSQFVENLVYKNKEEELVTYGKNLLADMDKGYYFDQGTLDQYQSILERRKIYFSVFDADGQILYPIENQNYKFQFSDEEWEQITNGKSVVVNVDLKRFDQAVSFVVLPYTNGDYFLGGVLLTAPVSGTNAMIHQFNKYLFYTILITLLVSLLLSWFLSKIHVRRINHLQKATSMIATGNYDVTVPSSNFDEIGELAGDFNQMVRKLRDSMDEIESLENRRRQFIADVSHEMRTPLTTISGVVEGLKNDMIPESEKEKGLELVSKETKRLIRLVNENLDYEKIRSNQVVLTKEKIELAEVLEIIKEQLDFQSAQKNNEIKMELQGNPLVYADYDRLIQILLNITKNSIQFTENGVIYLKGMQENDCTIIEIEDTGIGMDAKEIENIWRRFYKADLSRRTNPFGEFGLGLSIVKQLVLLHQGEIHVTSTKGHGTKFTIKLPLV
ncbi:HAMP domain-containing histidine kinase [Caldibacillus lycopersici]|uniref:histidine kinase n=1 Tax=Perspicuibacillus lycopersici TaxID=1325689 RepID=A0AAE3IV34_9BACI|nr:HAMP domain-containing sensor histidine kinase [Perspicuibacillus lycopersici]MCU9615076.1 HAMP domain-containing histidine kinase [Perspicuibacillus lycopersici]